MSEVPLYENSYGSYPSRKVDVRLPGKGKSNSYGARPVHLIITMIKLIRTSRLSVIHSLSLLSRQVEVEIESTRKPLVRAADTGHSNQVLLRIPTTGRAKCLSMLGEIKT